MTSDHSFVSCRLPVAVTAHPVRRRAVRSWRRLDRQAFRQAVGSSVLSMMPDDDADVDELFASYGRVLQDIADKLAPLHVVRQRVQPKTPWFDSECRRTRCYCLFLERRYRRTGDAADRLAWVQALRDKNCEFAEKKNAYWRQRLQSDGRSPAALWRSLSGALGKRGTAGSDLRLVCGFLLETNGRYPCIYSRFTASGVSARGRFITDIISGVYS